MRWILEGNKWVEGPKSRPHHRRKSNKRLAKRKRYKNLPHFA